LSQDFGGVDVHFSPQPVTNIGAIAETVPALNGETNMETPLAYTIAEACTVTRTGKTALYEAIKTGELRAVKRGRRTLVLPADLKDWIEKLPTIQRPRQHEGARRGASR
jgi:excisionase family DNA binding protein